MMFLQVRIKKVGGGKIIWEGGSWTVTWGGKSPIGKVYSLAGFQEEGKGEGVKEKGVFGEDQEAIKKRIKTTNNAFGRTSALIFVKGGTHQVGEIWGGGGGGYIQRGEADL